MKQKKNNLFPLTWAILVLSFFMLPTISFAIDGDDGRKYDPLKLPESFRKDGLQVKVSARIRRDAMSFHMYGAIIEVVNIAVR